MALSDVYKKNSTTQARVRYANRWAETIMKVLARQAERRHWNVVSFRGPNGGESRGIVDAIAVRKDHGFADAGSKRGDRLEIILIQLKGGRAPRPGPDDIARLRKVARHHRAKAIVLFEWDKGRKANFCLLHCGRWQPTTARDIFR